jgi:predicted nuclease with TOPRIM domain
MDRTGEARKERSNHRYEADRLEVERLKLQAHLYRLSLETQRAKERLQELDTEQMLHVALIDQIDRSTIQEDNRNGATADPATKDPSPATA